MKPAGHGLQAEALEPHDVMLRRGGAGVSAVLEAIKDSILSKEHIERKQSPISASRLAKMLRVYANRINQGKCLKLNLQTAALQLRGHQPIFFFFFTAIAPPPFKVTTITV